jgi:hypothetical protein
MTKNLFLSVALVALAALPASADVKSFATAKVSVDVPAGWKSSGSAEQMNLVDPTNEVGFVMVVTETADLKKVVMELDKRLASTMPNIKWAGDPKSDKLNGMDAIYNLGTAKVNGKDANVTLLLLHTPADKVLLVIGAVDSAKFANHKAEVQKLIASFKPAS